MTLQDEKRRNLLGRLGRRLGYATPALLLVASGAAFQAVASDTAAEPTYTSGQEAPLMLAEAHHADPETEAAGEAAGEIEREDVAEAEGEAVIESEGTAEDEPEHEALGEKESGAEGEDEAAEAEAEAEGEAGN
ncbi:hypothetical protein ACR80S_02020 [Halomonas sp. MA07-2]|uniref:hypothetical protein n=1 Tax=Halomonas sp. MA07-2 TaxID=3440841 RepID=UPI003EED4ECB